MGDLLGRRPEALIGKPGNLPSRRSSGDREESQRSGRFHTYPFETAVNQGLAAHAGVSLARPCVVFGASFMGGKALKG